MPRRVLTGGTRFRASKAWRALLIMSALAVATAALAQPPVVFLVRHAERAATSGHVPADTGLSAAGRERAQDLAHALKDAGIKTIFTTEYTRTQETATPFAESLGIRPEVVSADDFRSLVVKVRETRANVLVVGHSNTLPQIIRALGVASRITVTESDYDNLFLVILSQPPQLIHLHYR